MAQTPKSSQSSFLITVAGVPGTFARKSGGVKTGTVSKDRDGGAINPDVMPGFVDISDLTVSRTWRSSRDNPLAKKLMAVVNQLETTVRVQDLTPGKVVIPGTQVTYTGLLTSVTPTPDSDANSSSPAEFTLTFSISDVK